MKFVFLSDKFEISDMLKRSPTRADHMLAPVYKIRMQNSAPLTSKIFCEQEHYFC